MAYDNAIDANDSNAEATSITRMKNLFKSTAADSMNPLKRKGEVMSFKYPTMMKDRNFKPDGILGDGGEAIERSLIETGQAQDTNSFKTKVTKKIWKEFQMASPEDIDKKWFKPVLGPSAYIDTLKNLPAYIKAHPVRFAAGLGLTGGAYSIGKEPAKRLYKDFNSNSRVQDFKKNHGLEGHNPYSFIKSKIR